MAAIMNRVAPRGGRLDMAQMGAALMFKNCAHILRTANIKRTTGTTAKAVPKTTATNRAALAPETQSDRNARRLAAITK